MRGDLQKKDNVMVLADKHTMPFLDGRSHKIKTKLPKDILLQADIYDIHIRNFAPMGIRKSRLPYSRKSKFSFGSRSLPKMTAKQMDGSMRHFLKRHELDSYIKEEPAVLADGADIVDNGHDKAILAAEMMQQNVGRLSNIAVTLKFLTAFKSVAIMPTPSNSSIAGPGMSTRLCDIMAFLDKKHLAISELSPDDMEAVETVLWKKFRTRVSVIQLPTHYTNDSWKGRSGSCGLYTSLVSTPNNLYVPVFGNDPANWDAGHSSMSDKMATEIISVNAGPTKRVVPINVPKTICEAGIGLRSLVWQLGGDSGLADKIVHLGRYHGRRRLRRL